MNKYISLYFDHIEVICNEKPQRFDYFNQIVTKRNSRFSGCSASVEPVALIKRETFRRWKPLGELFFPLTFHFRRLSRTALLIFSTGITFQTPRPIFNTVTICKSVK